MMRFNITQEFIIKFFFLFIFLHLTPIVTFAYYVKEQKDIGSSSRIATINIRTSVKKDDNNSWEYRKVLMRNYIKHESFDIICMQEVTMTQFDFFINELSEYSSVGNPPGVVRGEEYLPIFYNKNKFKKVDSGTFWLSDKPDSIGSKGWDSAIVRRATWVKLRNGFTNKTILVVNTHLDHKGVNSRKLGMSLIKKKSEKIACHSAVVICGDMNSEPGSTPYKIALDDYFLMDDACNVAKERRGVNYSYHAFGKIKPQENRKMIDFIFVTKDIKVDELEIPIEYPINNVFLTDHNPVIAKIRF